MGGAIGSQVGQGRAVAVILGTVIGAVIGNQIGRNLDDQDRGSVDDALELAKDGQSVHWLNERSGVTYVVKPFGGAQNAGTCRNFKLQASRDGRAESQKSRACRTGDGAWRMSQ